MRMLKAALLAASFVATPVLAQNSDAETADVLIDQALESDLGYALLESLTTEIGPRLAGSEAEKRAAQWAVNNLKSLGFDKVWTEEVEIDGWTRGVETGRITAPFPQNVHLTALGHSVATPEKGVEAEIVAFQDVTELKAANPADVKGKIVYLSKRMTRTQDGSGYGPTVINRALGASEAAKLGALAVIIRSVGTDSHRMPHTGGLRYQPDAPKIPAAALSNPDADLLENMMARGKPVRFHLTMTPKALGKVKTQNVIAEVKGTKRPNEIIVIGGHLDSWDLGTGTIDDGAGVAITTAAAKLILDLPKAQRPARTIRIILWGAEETGLWGAKAYAETHKDELPKHILAAESDLGAGRIWKINSRIAESAVDTFREQARVLLPLLIDYGHNEGEPGPDVSPLMAAGVPIAELKQDGSDYFDLHHTPDDTLDKVDPEALAQNVAAYAGFIYMVANSNVDFRGVSN